MAPSLESRKQSRKQSRLGNQSTGILVETVSFQAGCITKLGYITIKYKEIWTYELLRRGHFRAQYFLSQTKFKVTSALAAVGSSAIGLNNALGSNQGVTDRSGFQYATASASVSGVSRDRRFSDTGYGQSAGGL